MIIINTRSELF